MEIKGKVTKNGQAEPFVKVFPSTLEGKPLSSGIGATTDFDGNFKLNIPDELNAKYINARSIDGDSVQKLNPSVTDYNIKLEFQQSQVLDEVKVVAKTPATECAESGGTWIPSTAGSKTKGECKIKPQVKTKKLNIKKYLIIGGVLLIVLGTAGYFIVKKVKSK